jgi:hypothetical protein
MNLSEKFLPTADKKLPNKGKNKNILDTTSRLIEAGLETGATVFGGPWEIRARMFGFSTKETAAGGIPLPPPICQVFLFSVESPLLCALPPRATAAQLRRAAVVPGGRSVITVLLRNPEPVPEVAPEPTAAR